MSTTVTGFHRVGVPAPTRERLVDELASVAAESLDRGETVVAAVDRCTESGLRERLGRGGGVEFTSPELVYRPFSAQSAAVARARELALLAGRGRCTAIERHRPWDERAPAGTYWLELDAALDEALDGLPVTMVCPLGPAGPDGSIGRAGAPVLPTAGDHPFLRVDGAVVPNDGYRPREPGSIPLDPPPVLGPPLFALPFDADRLRATRPVLARWAESVGLGPELRESLVLAASEVATNSVEHGGGTGTLSGWLSPAEVTVEVADRGRISDPLQGLRRPEAQQARGRGLWMARQMCPLVHVWSAPSGTHVRVAVPRTPAHRS